MGKTTLAKILIHELGIDPFDVMEINASRENNIDTIRAKITGFVQTMPFGDFKIVLLDEADYITPNGQAALRGVMETYSSTARFILTCNYPKFPDEPKATVVKLKAEPAKSAASDIEKARLAVSDAKDIAGLNRLRTLAGQRLTEGKFTKAEHDELVQLMLHRAEMLGDSDDGVAFEHEAAEHEVNA